MKKEKLMLGTLALVFAVASAIASRAIVPQTGYQQIIQSGQVVDCLAKGVCDNQMNAPICEFRLPDASLTQLRSSDAETQECGVQLTHSEGVIED